MSLRAKPKGRSEAIPRDRHGRPAGCTGWIALRAMTTIKLLTTVNPPFRFARQTNQFFLF